MKGNSWFNLSGEIVKNFCVSDSFYFWHYLWWKASQKVVSSKMICWGITYFGTSFMGFSFTGGGRTGGLCKPGNLILPGGSLRKSLVSGLSPEQRGESANTTDKYYHNW